jgi:hypothetical protein
MNEVPKASWHQYAMLLGALAAGMLTTQLVPAYQDHVGTVTYPSRAAATRADASGEAPRGFSHSQTTGPELTIVRSSS